MQGNSNEFNFELSKVYLSGVNPWRKVSALHYNGKLEQFIYTQTPCASTIG